MEWKKPALVIVWFIALFLFLKSGPLLFGGKKLYTTTMITPTTIPAKPRSILAMAILEGKSSVGMKLPTSPPVIVKKKPLVQRRKTTFFTTTTTKPTFSSIPTWQVFFCNVEIPSSNVEYTGYELNVPYQQQYWKEIFDLDRKQKFWISTNNPRTDRYISGTIHTGKLWEPDLVAQVHKRITNPQRVFVDVGAKIGYFSSLAAHRGAIVYSFEPVWGNYARMKLTKERNNFTSWKLYHNAADAVGGYTIRLSMASRSVNSGNFKISRSGREKAITTRVDDHVHKHVDLMKIDVEGYEAHVIMGATTLICHYGVDAIIIEFTQDLRTSPGCSWMKLFEWLHKVGYILKNTRENMVYLHWRGLGWKPRDANVVFVLRPGIARANCG